MGVIRVNLSDAVIEEINNKMKEINGDSVGTQVEMFLTPWINLINENKSTETKQTTNKQKPDKNKNKSKTRLPMYVQRQGEKYRFNKKYDGKPLKYLTFISNSLDTLLEFYKDFEKVGFDYEQFNIIKDKYVAPKNKGHIYSENSGAFYRIRKTIFSKDYTFLCDKSKDVLGPIRDYILWLSDEDKLQLYEDAKGQRPKKEYYLNRIKEDVEYQKYLKEKII